MELAPLVAGPPVGPLATLRIMSSPYGAYEEYTRAYGDFWRVDAVNGRVYVTADPEGARQLFAAQPATFAPFGTVAALPLIGEHSLFMMSGPKHHRERKLLMPAFHGERIAGYGERIRDLSRATVARLEVGQVVAAQDLGLGVALDVILSLVFGAATEADRAPLRALIEEAVDTVKPWMLFAPPLRRLPLASSRWAAFVDARDRARATATERIEHARRAGAGDSVLAAMIVARDEDGEGMRDEEIVDELFTLLFAGHETTAVAIAWTMEHLHRNPRTLARLRAELAPLADTPALELAKNPWLDACCKEALRITPIVPDVVRNVVTPFRWMGHDIEVGANVAALTSVIHHREDLYPEPARYRPQRFLERRFRPWQYLPFGGGARRCIGATLADLELRLAVAAFVMGRTFELVDGAPPRPVRRNITIAPEGGTRLLVRA